MYFLFSPATTTRQNVIDQLNAIKSTKRGILLDHMALQKWTEFLCICGHSLAPEEAFDSAKSDIKFYSHRAIEMLN